MSYSHTQRGWVIIAVLAILVGIEMPLLLLLPRDAHMAIVGVTVFVAVILILFSSLTASVDSQEILLYFGPGLIRRRISLADVAAADTIATKWWYGFGIRLTPIGWMWNVSGLKAVKVSYKNGKAFLIGTDDPDGLAAAIRRHLAS